MYALLRPVSTPRRKERAENLIVLGKHAFLALKHQVHSGNPDSETLRSFLLAAARCLGVTYAFADFNLREMKFPFLKKSPVWLQPEASEITLRLIRTTGDHWGILSEAEHLRRSLEAD